MVHLIKNTHNIDFHNLGRLLKFMRLFCSQGSSELPSLVLIQEEEALKGKSGSNSSQAIIIVCFLAVLIIVIAMFSNALAFLVFYKKPMFRKILSNR